MNVEKPGRQMFLVSFCSAVKLLCHISMSVWCQTLLVLLRVRVHHSGLPPTGGRGDRWGNVSITTWCLEPCKRAPRTGNPTLHTWWKRDNAVVSKSSQWCWVTPNTTPLLFFNGNTIYLKFIFLIHLCSESGSTTLGTHLHKCLENVLEIASVDKAELPINF